MKAIARSLVVIMVALIAVPALVVSVAITSAVQLLATTALIMGGTQHPLSNPPDTNEFIQEYLGLAENHYITPVTGAPDNRVPVVYPAEFFPVFGSTTFDDSVDDGRGNLGSCLGGGSCNDGDPVVADHFIVFGYSQSAVVASLVKNDLINDPTPDPALEGTEFFLISNPMRANGGILGRGFEGLTIPILGITFYGPTQNSCAADPCTAADGYQLPTTDVAQQYDFLGGDAPARLDPLAFANSIAAYALLHGNVPNRTLQGGVDKDPQIIFQDEYGDTKYYMITAPRLPLLMLLEQAGVPGPALALPDALLRVWIEDKYRRDLSPGEHVQFQLSPIGNPVALVGNMLGAIPVGIDDTVQQAGGGFRPLGTADVYRPFGVGGPVYDKTTGVKTTDNVGIPTGAGDYDTQDSLQTLGQPQAGDNDKLAIQGEDQGNVIKDETPQDDENPKGTKPDPFAKLRESLKFDPDKRPLGIRPHGDGPLTRIVKKLTGQPSEAKDNDVKNDEPKAAA